MKELLLREEALKAKEEAVKKREDSVREKEAALAAREVKLSQQEAVNVAASFVQRRASLGRITEPMEEDDSMSSEVNIPASLPPAPLVMDNVPQTFLRKLPTAMSAMPGSSMKPTPRTNVNAVTTAQGFQVFSDFPSVPNTKIVAQNPPLKSIASNKTVEESKKLRTGAELAKENVFLGRRQLPVDFVIDACDASPCKKSRPQTAVSVSASVKQPISSCQVDVNTLLNKPTVKHQQR